MSPKDAAPETTLNQSDAWIAENPGDSISGTVQDLDVAWSDFRARHLPSDPNGGNYPLIIVRTDEGDVKKIHAFRTVLFNEVVKRQPKPGERIVVTFTGYGKEKQGMDRAHLYSVETPDRDPNETAKNVYGRIPNAAPAATEEAAQDEIPF